MAQALDIRVLGELEIRAGGERLAALESARARSLLAHLLVRRGTPVSRRALAFSLWPDSSERQARTNLRHVLHTLRNALPAADCFVRATASSLEWRADAPFELDLAAFEAALERGDDEAAVDAYRGDLLEGCYDEWLLEERERLRAALGAALERICLRLEAAGRHAEALRHGERLLRHDPLREETYRLLMRLHDARGDRARAVRVFHACTAALERELAVAPSEATRAAYDALLPDGAATAGADRLPLVGRAPERARLAGLWRESERGRAQLVLVTGEPGIGKTRLLEELRSWCAHRGATTAEARSYPAEGALAFGPVAAWLRTEALAARRLRLDRGRLAELARVLPEISGVPRPQALPEAEQRLRLFDAVCHALIPSGPLLLVADDLQWADQETLQLLHYLLRTRPAAPLLIAAGVRREDAAALAGLRAGAASLGRLAEIDLCPLTPAETAALAGRAGGRDLDARRAERLFAETEGNPLFVVEAMRGGWRPGALSPRVQAVIEERLARLSPAARELAGVAATVGREFTAGVLARVDAPDEARLVAALDELWRRRLIRERGSDAYDFSHDKVREVAYAGLGPARRRRNHLLIAQALEALRPGEPGLVALHFDRAGAARPAVAWYARAAAAAQRMHAGAEAIRLLERALELADGAQERLEVVTSLVPLVANAEGYGSERVGALQRTALELSAALGAEPGAPLLRSLALLSLSRGDFEGSRRYGGMLADRGRRERDGVLLVESRYVLGISAFWDARLADARRHFEAAIAAYRPEHRATHLLSYGYDPLVVCTSRLANTLAFLGDAGGARRTCERALAIAGELAHPASTETALVFAALLALDLGDAEGVRRHAAALQGASLRAAGVAGEALGGYVDVLDGMTEAGLARVRRALDDAGDHAPGHHACLARIALAACEAAGDDRASDDAARRLLAAGAGAALWASEARRRQARPGRNARGTPARA